jgi:hypothetical protein
MHGDHDRLSEMSSILHAYMRWPMCMYWENDVHHDDAGYRLVCARTKTGSVVKPT